MCGIAGIATRQPEAEIDRALLQRMMASITHRGPDHSGFHLGPGVALGHNRLSIIDLSTGDQPIFNEDRTVAVVFNGEIYNYEELRAQLQAKGHRFTTQTDTEVLVHLWEEHGEAMTERLVGMFAFAIWDSRQRSLFLARDRTGQKPLVYMEAAHDLVFASEIKALRQHPAFRGDLDTAALGLFLGLLYIPAPWTIHRHVKKLMPGHQLLWKGGQSTVQRFWSPPLLPDTRLDIREWEENFWRLFREAVRSQMVADVPMGAFLSGGIDSSMIVATMRKFDIGPVRTFSMGFGNESTSELPHARVVARRFGTDHHEFDASEDPVAVLRELSVHYDEPFADTSNVPTYLLAMGTRPHVKVALSGDGGDELFGGYTIVRNYLRALHDAALPATRVAEMEAAARAPRATPGAVADWESMRWWRRVGEDIQDRAAPYFALVERQYFRPSEQAALLTPDWSDTTGLEELGHRYRPTAGMDPTLEALRFDLFEYLPGDINAKVDIASMRASLEVRSPFLDHRLIEHAFRLPAAHKVDREETKKVLRRLARQLLPESIVARPKMGFGAPIADWLCRPEMRSATEQLVRDAGATPFRRQPLEHLVRSFYAGDTGLAYRLWQLLCFKFWQDGTPGAEATKANPIHPSLVTGGGRTNPAVSVIMSVYNGGRFLDDAVASILAQTHSDLEFILINDASTDGSELFVRKLRDQRVRVLHNTERLGLTASLNRGLREARGNLIARMDADDICHPDRLRQQIAFLQDNPSVALVGCVFERIDEAGKRLDVSTLPLSSQEVRVALKTSNCVCHGSVVMRRDAILAVGGYREELRYAQDYDLWLRLAEKFDLANLPGPLYSLRLHRDAVSIRRSYEQQVTVRLIRQLAERRRCGHADQFQDPALRQAFIDEYLSALADAEARHEFLMQEYSSRHKYIVELESHRDTLLDRIGTLERQLGPGGTGDARS